jgi:hypothetical protein
MPHVLKAADILCAAGALIDVVGESCLSKPPNQWLPLAQMP